MKTMIAALAIATVLALSFAVTPASACPGVCVLEGKEYSNGANIGGHDYQDTVCSCIDDVCKWVKRDRRSN